MPTIQVGFFINKKVSLITNIIDNNRKLSYLNGIDNKKAPKLWTATGLCITAR